MIVQDIPAIIGPVLGWYRYPDSNRDSVTTGGF